LGVAAGGDYAANAGVYFNYAETEDVDRARAGPIYTYSNIRNRQVTDGASKTFAVGERHIPPPDSDVPPEMTHWMQGDCAFFAADTPWGIFADTRRGLANSRRDRNREKYGSEHPGVTLFVFLDGHVEGIDNDTDLNVLNWYCAIGDGHDPTSGVDLEDGNDT
jgi:prepilin-type processing-associated H-X9-DG protein